MLDNLNSDSVVYSEEGVLVELTRKLDAEGHQSVLLVSGKGSYQASGAERLLQPVLAGREVTRVCDFETNPNKDDVVRLLGEISNLDYSVIIAVGGGSVIDVAKLIKCFRGKAGQIDGVLYGGQTPEPSEISLFVIPTTAGSGSEATHFAVVRDQEEKFSVAHPGLLPDTSWVVPALLSSMPSAVAAAAAMDAFCQGVESYWSIHSTSESKKLAEKAIKLSWQNMIPAVLAKDKESLAWMGEASHLAGEAINITKTTAPHAISYALTTHFGISHGHAVALMLPDILVFNDGVAEEDLLDERGCDYVRSSLTDIGCMIGCHSVGDTAGVIAGRMQELGLSRDLQELGINNVTDLELIVKNGFNPDRVNNNPRRITEYSLSKILQKMLEKG